MLIETGRVVAVDDEGLWVETIRKSTCGSCAAQAGCGHGILNRLGSDRRGYVRVLPGKVDTTGCEVDDQVRISIPEEVILRGSLVVYMVPLAFMLGGALLAVGLFPESRDWPAMAGALLGFAAGWGVVRWHAWRHRADSNLQPTLLEITRPAADPVKLA